MRLVKVYDKETRNYIGEVKASKEQIREIERSFIVKEV